MYICYYYSYLSGRYVTRLELDGELALPFCNECVWLIPGTEGEL